MYSTMTRGVSYRAIATLVIIATSLLTSAASAATFTWNGGGAANLTWAGNNWLPGTLPAAGSHDLVWRGTGTATGVATGTWGVSSMTFDNTLGANTSIIGSGTGNPGPALLNISGNITQNAGRVVRIGGSVNSDTLYANFGNATATRNLNVNSGTLRFQASILGGSTGVTIAKTGTGALELTYPTNAVQAFDGTFNLQSGSTRMFRSYANANVANQATSTLQLGDGTTSAAAVDILSLDNLGVVLPRAVTNVVTGTLSGGSIGFGVLPLDPTEAQVSTMVFSGPALLGGGVTATISTPYPNATLEQPVTFNLFDFNGPTTGDFSSFDVLYDATNYSLNKVVIDGNTYFVSPTLPGGESLFFDQSSGNLVIVPEPSTIVFAALGLTISGVHCINKRRRNKSAIAA